MNIQKTKICIGIAITYLLVGCNNYKSNFNTYLDYDRSSILIGQLLERHRGKCITDTLINLLNRSSSKFAKIEKNYWQHSYEFEDYRDSTIQRFIVLSDNLPLFDYSQLTDPETSKIPDWEILHRNRQFDQFFELHRRKFKPFTLWHYFDNNRDATFPARHIKLYIEGNKITITISLEEWLCRANTKYYFQKELASIDYVYIYSCTKKEWEISQ